MRLLFVIGSLNRGGAENQLILLGSGLVELGYEVHVLALTGKGSLDSKAIDNGIKLHYLDSNRFPKFLRLTKLVGFIRNLRPNVVHSYMPGANAATSLMRYFFKGVPLVWGVRASNYGQLKINKREKFLWFLQEKLYSKADLIICNSNAGKEYLSKKGVTPDLIRVVYNGVDSLKFSPNKELGLQFRSEYLGGFDGKIVGMLARFDLVKGHIDFLHLSALLSEDFHKARYVIVGNHSRGKIEELMDLSKKLGVSKNVHIINEVEDPSAALNAFDVLVSVSKSEGFPNAVLESMACGTPVVATDVGDTEQIIGGLCPVFQVGDLKGMSDSIAQILKSKVSPEVLIRSRAVNEFPVQKLVMETDALLKQLNGDSF